MRTEVVFVFAEGAVRFRAEDTMPLYKTELVATVQKVNTEAVLVKYSLRHHYRLVKKSRSITELTELEELSSVFVDSLSDDTPYPPVVAHALVTAVAGGQDSEVVRYLVHTLWWVYVIREISLARLSECLPNYADMLQRIQGRTHAANG